MNRCARPCVRPACWLNRTKGLKRMKRLAGLTALALIITGTGGCSWLGLRDRGSDYLQAQQTTPMRLPEGVQVKHLDPLLPIPSQIAAVIERDKEFETPRP